MVRSWTSIAATGQGATQAPHPVQAAASSAGRKRPSARGAKRIAEVGQASPQVRQWTPPTARQRPEISAFAVQARTPTRVNAFLALDPVNPLDILAGNATLYALGVPAAA